MRATSLRYLVVVFLPSFLSSFLFFVGTSTSYSRRSPPILVSSPVVLVVARTLSPTWSIAMGKTRVFWILNDVDFVDGCNTLFGGPGFG